MHNCLVSRLLFITNPLTLIVIANCELLYGQDVILEDVFAPRILSLGIFALGDFNLGHTYSLELRLKTETILGNNWP
jgi:hypothetical protein